MQAEPAKFANCSLPAAAGRIVQENGPGFLLQGLAPTVVGYGVEGALKFGVYELTKPLFAGATPVSTSATIARPAAERACMLFTVRPSERASRAGLMATRRANSQRGGETQSCECERTAART